MRNVRSWIGLGCIVLAGCTLSPSGRDHPAPQQRTREEVVAPDPELSQASHPEAFWPTSSDTSAVARRLRDRALTTQVLLALNRALQEHGPLPIVTVHDRVVTLEGPVASEFLRERIMRMVTRVPGVTRVVDNMEVAGAADAQQVTARYHTVRSGETLWDIARRYGLSVAQLQRMNGLQTRVIRPGQRLRVR